MTEQRPILVDVCWTLYRSNTTFDFLDWLIHDPGYLRLRRWGRSRWGHRLVVGILRLTGHDVQRMLALRYLRPYSEKTISDKAQEFVDSVLSKRQIPASWDIIRGRRVVLATGTMPFIAQVVAQQTNAETVYAGDIFKHNIRNQYTDYDILTDNISDIELVHGAQHAYIVVYNNEARWQQLLGNQPHTFIHVDERRY